MSMKVDSGGGVFAEINITPLTDIFLVLLIIFMVTTSVTIESAAHVDLPKAEQPAPTDKPKGLIVTYTDSHQLFINEKNVSESELEPQLRDALSKQDDKIVVFQGDQKVLLGEMVHILDICKRAGAVAIAIAASKGNGGGGAPGGAPGAG